MLWHCWLSGRKGIQPIKNGGWWRWALVSPDGVAPSRMVGVSASVNLPLHHKGQKFSSGTVSPGWSRKKGRKWLWWWWCFSVCAFLSTCVCISVCMLSLADVRAYSIIGSRSGFPMNLNPNWIRLTLDTPKVIRFAKWIWTQILCESRSGPDNRIRP